MISIMELYNSIARRVKQLRDDIRTAESAVVGMEDACAGEIPARIEKLEEQLEKIDEYLLKIEAFEKLAERNLESLNVLTIEAPPQYRVNLNRLRNWAMMIDPMSPNDPYAQRVYVVAKCDQCFLNRKKQEFVERIAALRNDQAAGMSSEIGRLEARIRTLYDELAQLAASDEMSGFSAAVKETNGQYWYEAAPETYSNSDVAPALLSPGAYALPLDLGEGQRERLKRAFGKFYDADGARVLLPVELNAAKEFALSVSCAPHRAKQLDRALQNLLLSVIDSYPAGNNKAYVLDAVRYNSSMLGSLKQLEDTFALAAIPRNPEQMTAVLEQIVSSFADMDDMLELCDSVAEYNAMAEPARCIPRTTLILIGWPNAFGGRDREYVQRIMVNYERYGVSFVSVSYRTSNKDEDDLPEYAAQNAVYIDMQQNETTVCRGLGAPQHFTWYTMVNGLPESYAASLKANKVEKSVIGNEYTKRYDFSAMPSYTRAYKKIELPFGIDGKDAAHSVSFENENFAAYLVGASRSGKSTLLHTLIAGIIRNYHPDNVELWLADFKQLEFKKYIDHCPPHVKYILLDESTELVYDLIDKLTDKMMERQHIFSRIGRERIDQINPADLSEPMPVIFVILDEFSIMSQSIAESQTYRLRLQNLLAKGAALGIRFLFSSQTFTTGIAGLTPAARAQIQQRIAMKGAREEISETLELSANLKTEQVRNWMEALPPHYALVKYRISADTLPRVKRVLVMYFKDYAPRDELVKRLNGSMKKVERYTPGDIGTYVDKHPVLIDGNTYAAFQQHAFLAQALAEKTRNAGDYTGDETFVSFGAPRLMTSMKLAAITPEARENLLLIGRAMEQACSAAVISSVMRAFLAQGRRVQVWAYEKNRLYRAYRGTAWSRTPYAQVAYVEGMDAICDAIYTLKTKMRGRQAGSDLIVLIGMDRICSDFGFVEEGGGAGMPAMSFAEKKGLRDAALMASGAIVDSDEDARKQEFAAHWAKKRSEVKQKAKTEGKSTEQIQAAIDAAREEFFAQTSPTAVVAAPSPAAVASAKTAQTAQADYGKQEQASEVHTPGAYDAGSDFQYIMKQGSRWGYHFLMFLNAYADLKQTGVKADLFRHKLAFQVSVDDSRELFGNKNAASLPEHICQYYDTLERYSFRPYLHEDICWDGWYVDNDTAVNPFVEK